MKEKREIKIIKLDVGEFYMYADKIPCVEIINKETGKAVGYLSAFRDYKFQVSGTWEGESDQGSTPVFGLQTFRTVRQEGRSNLNNVETKKFIIEACAKVAIMNFTNRRNVFGEDYDKELHYDFPTKIEIGTYNCNQEWEKFIEACYNRYCEGIDLIPGHEYSKAS